MRAQHLGPVVAAACMLWVLSACNSSTPQAVASPSPTPTPSASASPAGSPGGCAGQATLPSDFPADFPIYPGAQPTAACKVPGSGSTQWTVQWLTTDSVNSVQTYYVSELDKNDWILSGYSGDINTRFSATFQRKSNASAKGSLQVTRTSSQTKIVLTLTTIP